MQDSDCVVVTTTIDDRARADEMAGRLVESGVAACVQSWPVRSTYRWKGRVERGDEILLAAKAGASGAQRVVDMIRSLHTYELPEIVVTSLAGGSREYLDWVLAESGGPASGGH